MAWQTQGRRRRRGGGIGRPSTHTRGRITASGKFYFGLLGVCVCVAAAAAESFASAVYGGREGGGIFRWCCYTLHTTYTVSLPFYIGSLLLSPGLLCVRVRPSPGLEISSPFSSSPSSHSREAGTVIILLHLICFISSFESSRLRRQKFFPLSLGSPRERERERLSLSRSLSLWDPP